MSLASLELSPFEPHPLLRGGYAQTLGGHLLGKPPPAATSRALPVDLGDGDRLLLHVDAPAKRSRAAVVLMLHGLGGCSGSSYMLRISAHLTARGFLVARFNHRGCGVGGASLARNVYHAGRVLDLDAALAALAVEYPGAPLLVCGFSLSANLLLRYLGQGATPTAGWRVHPQVAGALAVCAPVDLELCSQALAARRNLLLDRYYTRLVRGQIADKHRLFPDLPPPQWPERLDLRALDEHYTAPRGGFHNRDDYYKQSSARPWLVHIKAPTVIITADDDPIVPPASFADAALSAAVRHIRTHSGGHMGYMSARATSLGNRRWMDASTVAWAESHG